MSSISRNLKLKMAEKGETAHSIEKKLGLGNGSVRNILNGETENPRKRTIETICNFLECSPKDLFHEKSFNKDENTISWDRVLFGRCLCVINERLIDYGHNLNQEKIISLTEDLYEYSHSSGEADRSFADFIIKKQIKP